MRFHYAVYGALMALVACSPEIPTTNAPAAASPPIVSAPTAPTAVFEGANLRGESIGGDFTLTAHNGREVKLADWRGKVVVLVFGFTHCPDVCPTHLMTYAQALSQLSEAEAKQVQVFFISVDPARDTPDLLSHYVTVFNENFIGLTSADGQDAPVRAVMRQYQVAANKLPAREDGFYFVEHSTTTYMIDRKGKVAVAAPLGQTANQLAHDLRLLIAETP